MTAIHQDIKHLARMKEMKKNALLAIRSIAGIIKHETDRQCILDLTTSLGPTKPPRYEVLPSKPTGFVLGNAEAESKAKVNLRTQCEFQMITMLITYFWMYCLTNDMQDMRSFMRYKGWIDRYVNDYNKYEVCGDIRRGYWLCNTSVLKEDEHPTLPKWLKDDGGETI